MEDQGGNTYSLANVDWQNPDTTYLELSMNRQSTGCRIPLLKKKLHRGQWDELAFHFDLETDTIIGILNGEITQQVKAALPEQMDMSLLLGSEYLYVDEAMGPRRRIIW